MYQSGKDSDAPPSQGEITAVGQLIEDMAKAGVLVATEGLQPSSKGARVRISGEKFTETDGPFVETKELIAGYAIVKAKSKGDAIEPAKRFLKVMGERETEVRLMHDTPAFESGNAANRPAATAKR
ncbi:MAG TPA: YciI family protein [Vicinamibacteria bacterium]|nr:YciI family protein [Vicinamibacteria bacterium]